ncbi:MAG: dTDP-4-dehydrorhamnose reductase, partial [Bryobacteraceae bacterium]
MRILVTGASGQVGRALLLTLPHHDLIAANRSLIDLSQPDACHVVLGRLKPEIVINAAAYTAVDQAESQSDVATLVNAEAPAAMARWAAEHGVPFVHFSTDYVFDGQGSVPRREIDSPAQLSVYGWTKLRGEKAVQAAGGKHLIVRTSWVFSAIGKNFMRTIASLALDRKELRVVADQIGAPTSAALIADCLNKMLANGLENFDQCCAKSRGLVNLAAAGETSWHGFACAIVDGLRKREIDLAVETIVPISTKEYQTPARRPLNSRLDLTRLRGFFSIYPDNWRTRLETELDLLA